MKKQALAIAIASALVAPSAFAAQDTSGMQYTSAAEGFYASLRAQIDFSSGDNDADINEGSSRIGIRGTNDLGGGLEGFYQWEAEVGIDDGTPNSGNDSEFHTRLGHVGLRGGFGEIVAGSFWTADYSFTHGSTDVANVYSGWLTYSDRRESRSERSLQYTTPDLNGFQGAILAGIGNGDNGESEDNGNDLDSWNLSAQYAIQGFTVAGSYNVIVDGQGDAAVAAGSTCVVGTVDDNGTPDNFTDDTCINGSGGAAISGATAVAAAASTQEDLTSWTVRLGYAQDNWYVNGWYGEDDYSEGDAAAEDVETFSVAAGVAVDRVNLYVLYEAAENAGRYGGGGSQYTGMESSYGTLGVQYTLGANSRVWIEYFSQDVDSNESLEDVINIGLRHDF